MDLALNHFNSSLPSNMFLNLPNLQVLGLGGNQFTGPIPVSIVNASMLSGITIPKNHFTGPVPNLGKLHKLSYLELFSNNLGSNSTTKDLEFFESLMNCSELNELVLTFNNFGGHLPNCMCNWSTHLTSIYLQDNQFYGQIPEALGNLLSLRSLSMDNNHLAEIIPTTLGKLQSMEFLSLSANKLSGKIIRFIGNLTRLFHLDLSNNMLEGQVPPSIRNCESLVYLDLSQNNFRGAIVHVMGLPYLSILLNLSRNSFIGHLPNEVGKLTKIDKLDVSHNHLTGNIPQTIGDCQSLEYLCLQGNFFQEDIPLSLASLKGLRYLDLSQNNLFGSILKDLQDIALEYLNISFNMLDGEIPRKGVFSNASATSLIGNNKLCGGISQLELPPCPIKSNGQRKHQNFKLIISTCCVIAFLLLASIVAIYHWRRRSKKSSLSSPTIDMISKVSYQSLDNATNGFSVKNLIGSGSFGLVYKGSLES
ncbi:probable LRR receptor-like serine/threonine-protein kinase At3g47570 [Neltuma alba]|uniref:probable LRR receptor-like serine/threonine-protein kinase At3g47570 n=1 Tax=Neltuma alba TaxID=207710 RepID=UPI0010A2E148|nr:probable LRR receptor-like serine/threonine-protein kinase At3g47570 [Prosopis alba]